MKRAGTIGPQETDQPRQLGNAERQHLNDYFATRIGITADPPAINLTCHSCGQILARCPSRYTFERQEEQLAGVPGEALILTHVCKTPNP